ncbi:MAG: GxxExxY protein [Verrucomicrobiota bacterium]
MKPQEIIAKEAVDSALKIHRKLGSRLFETVYETVLASELAIKGFTVDRQKTIHIEFEGKTFEEGFRADLWIDNYFIVEVKSIDKLAPIHTKQLLTYLRLAKLPLGLLINFGEETLKESIKRIPNFEYLHKN